MQQHLNDTDGDGPVWELYPPIAAIAANYGDPDGKYAAFMANADNEYPAEPYFLLNQNFSDSGLPAATPTAGGPLSTASSKSGAGRRYENMFSTVLLGLGSSLAVVLSSYFVLT
jgi:hypothetical protein